MFTGTQGIALKLPRSVKAAALAVSLVFSAALTAVAWRSPDYGWLVWFSFLPLFVAVRWLRPVTAALAGGLWGTCLYLFFTAGPTAAAEALAPAIDPTVPAIGLSACVHAQEGPSAWLLALLIVIPAVYVGLAARPARGSTGTRKRAGPLPVSSAISLLTLALGWTLLGVVLFGTYPNTPEPPASARAVLQNRDYSDSLINRPAPQQGLLTGSQGEGSHHHWLARLLGYVFSAFLVACTTHRWSAS